jgi:hypothetical protein
MVSMAELHKAADELNRKADELADKINKTLEGCNVQHCIMALMKMNCQVMGELHGQTAAHELMELLIEANAEIFERYHPSNHAQAEHDPEESALVSLVRVMPTTPVRHATVSPKQQLKPRPNDMVKGKTRGAGGK